MRQIGAHLWLLVGKRRTVSRDSGVNLDRYSWIDHVKSKLPVHRWVIYKTLKKFIQQSRASRQQGCKANKLFGAISVRGRDLLNSVLPNFVFLHCSLERLTDVAMDHVMSHKNQ